MFYLVIANVEFLMVLMMGRFVCVGICDNLQPSEAEVGFDLRLPPTVDPDLKKALLKNGHRLEGI